MRRLAIIPAFVRRDWAIALSYRFPFVLELFGTILILALFFYLGKLFNPGAAGSAGTLGRGYFAFAAVGLALLRILQVGLASFVQRLRDEQTTGTFEALMATPTPPSLIILSSAAFDLLRATVTGIAMILLAVVVFGLRIDLSPALILVPVALLGSIGLFAALGIVLAGFTVVFKQSAAALNLVVPGLALLGGVYFPISVLPEPLHAIASALPLTWGLDVLRKAMILGDADVARLAGLMAAAVVALPLALGVFEAALRRARREGTLAQY